MPLDVILACSPSWPGWPAPAALVVSPMMSDAVDEHELLLAPGARGCSSPARRFPIKAAAGLGGLVRSRCRARPHPLPAGPRRDRRKIALAPGDRSPSSAWCRARCRRCWASRRPSACSARPDQPHRAGAHPARRSPRGPPRCRGLISDGRFRPQPGDDLTPRATRPGTASRRRHRSAAGFAGLWSAYYLRAPTPR